jgi:MoxR-like ATPase
LTAANPRPQYPPPLARTDLACERAAVTVAAVIDEVERAVVGKRSELELIVAAMLAGGHVLLDDVPGVAKTLAARSIATAAGLSFSRIQFTPDVLPSDITGATVIDVGTGRPAFRRGPVFAELVLADEINRAPAKTQAALLEAMQEFQVTIDGATHRLPNPFFVIATENPVESEGTYPLPEAQLDRFIVRAHLGYPGVADEVEMVTRRLARGTDEVVIRQVADTSQLEAVRLAVEHVHIEPVLVAYVVDIINASRKHRELSLGASPRGSLAVVKVARARAVLHARDFVTPDDVRAIALPALTHRVVLSDEAWARGTRAHDVMRAVIDSVAAPSWK